MMKVFINLLFLAPMLVADVKSTTGDIKFDTQGDNQAEMILNNTGLGIGIIPSSNLHVNGNVVVSDQLSVGGESGSSNLNINGTLGYSFDTVISDTTLGELSIVLADSSSDNITVTMPYAGNVTGREYQIKKISALNSVWILGGGNLIDDTNHIELPESTDLASVKLISDGVQWFKIEQKDISETIAEDNLLGWWKFDETSGNIAFDSSSQNNHGTLNNGLDFTSDTTDGVFKNALSFDGVDDYIVIDEIDVPSGNFMTLSCWARFTDPQPGNSNIGFLITKSASVLAPNNPYTVSINNTTVQIRADGRTRSSSSGQNDNSWHHIVMVISDDIFSLYYDGEYVGDQTFELISNDNQTSFGSSVDSPASRPYKGDLDDIRIYNLSLNIDQVRILYHQGL